MDYTTISIDLEVYKLIQNNLNSFEETPNDVLRRLLKLESVKPENRNDITTNNVHAIGAHNPIGDSYKGISFRNGLKLRKIYKGELKEAEVKDGKFFYKEKSFDSPSAAAIYATGGTSVNGWLFWEYYDVLKNKWIVLDNLRNK